jgi:hypothetical protein
MASKKTVKPPRRLLEGERFNPYAVYHGTYIPGPDLAVRRTDLLREALLCGLVRFNGRNNKCHPKIQQLADELRVTKRPSNTT